MAYLILQRLLKELSRKASTHRKGDRSSSVLGFTMIELLIVLIIVGVLAGIAAPAWLTFTNRQRLNTATNKVFTVLKSAQSDSKRDSSKPKPVTIDVANGKISILGAAQELLDSAIKITAVTEGTTPSSIISSNTATILFDGKGTPYKLNASNQRIDAVIPIQIKFKHDLIGQEQCVTIRTLLGTIDDKCALFIN